MKFQCEEMSGKCQEKVRNFPHVWNWCKEKSVCRNSTHWKNVRNFSFDFSSSDECVENVRKFILANSTHSKCEEILSSHFPMWGKDFLTLENVRKSFLHIGKCEEILSSHWKMWRKDSFTLENVRNYSKLFWVIVRIFFFFWKGVGNVSIRFPYSWKCEDLHAYEISMWGKCEEKVRNFPHVWNWCKEKSVCRNSTHWKNVRNFSFDFPARTTVWKNVRKFVAANSTHAKCEEIEDGLGKYEETLSSHQRMWGNIASRSWQ